MSCLIRPKRSLTCYVIGTAVQGQNNDELQPPDYSVPITYVINGENDYMWPRSSLTGFDYLFVAPVWESRHQDWESWINYTSNSGTLQYKKLKGVAKDANNNVLANVTIKLFATSNNLLLDTQTTATDGSYMLNAYDTSNGFVVVIDTTTITGTSVNTLQGT